MMVEFGGRSQAPGIIQGFSYRNELLNPRANPGMETSDVFRGRCADCACRSVLRPPDQHEIGSLGVEMCRYGSTFCDKPYYVLTGAILAAIWGGFVSVR